MTIPRPSDGRVRWEPAAVLALTLLAALGRFPWLGAQDLWFDEVFSVVLASQDVGELVRRAIADQNNPPGFYLLLWGWVRLGTFGEAWIRALPAVAGTLTVPAVIALGRTLGMRWGAALLGGLLAAVSPLLFAMSLEVRAYAPLALCTTLSLTLAVRMAARDDAGARRARGALVLVDAALVMLHLFGALAVLARVGAAWLVSRGDAAGARRRARRDAVVTAQPAAALLLAWSALVLAAAHAGRVGGNADWIPAPGAAALLGFGSLVLGTFGTTAGLWGVAAVLVTAALVARRRPYAAWLLVPALLPLVVVLAAGALTGRSLWVGRYLVVVLPAVLLLAADLAEALAERLPATWRAAPFALLGGWAVATGVLAAMEAPPKPPWSRIVPALAAGGPTTVCVNESFVGLPLQYHAIRSGVPLAVRDLSGCIATRAPGWVMLRPGTFDSLEALRQAGARLGRARALGTTLPPVLLYRLEWPAP